MKNVINLLVVFGMMFVLNIKAQSHDEEWSKLVEQDSVDITSISLYPKNTRTTIFKICTQSEAMVKLKDIQEKSQENFRKEISKFSQADQENIWNMTRYPGLLDELAATKGEKKQIENILKKYPEEIRGYSLDYSVSHYGMIMSIYKISKDFETSFKNLVKTYPTDLQTAFQEIMKTPEVLTMLNNNIHMAIHLGSIYKSKPEFLENEMDKWGVMAAEQNTKEKEKWKKEMESDPAISSEMKESSKEFASDYGYTEKECGNVNPDEVVKYVYIPYAYWSGYPFWYESPIWYPYPYWYHSGFYYWNNSIIWLGPPSYFFVSWHFHNHEHIHHYPHMTNTYINQYYYGPRGNISRNSAEVNDWMRANEKTLPTDFKTNLPERINRLREFGKSGVDRENYLKTNPARKVTHEEYIRNNQNQYPHLKNPVTKDIKSPEIKSNEPIKPGSEIKQSQPVQKDPKPSPSTPKPEKKQPAPSTPPLKSVPPKSTPTQEPGK
ncbi:MAG: hypothetical protein KBD57_10840 [Bacteroidia bacterium]|nr:hypothetical protein [Bacteroidia bacterium]